MRGDQSIEGCKGMIEAHDAALQTRAQLRSKRSNHFGKCVTLRDGSYITEYRHARSTSNFIIKSTANMLSSLLVRAFALCLLLNLPSVATAHLIEVAAAKKECFFEDLHKNDQVSSYHMQVFAESNMSIDDCNLSSWRWRTS